MGDYSADPQTLNNLITFKGSGSSPIPPMQMGMGPS
jgi:hypothetical protein